eukprot:1957038-Amphidinium_carterae.1
MSVTLAVEKGRCHDPQMLSLIRRLSAMTLAAHSRLRVRWVPSELNPSDFASRLYHAAVKQSPERPTPGCWRPRHRAFGELSIPGNGSSVQRATEASAHTQEGAAGSAERQGAQASEVGSGGFGHTRDAEKTSGFTDQQTVGGGTSILEQCAVQPATLRDYERRLAHLENFCGRSSPELSLLRFFDHLFMAGATVAAGSKCLVAVLHFRPDLTVSVSRCRRALQGWNKRAPNAVRMPVPYAGVAAICIALAWLNHP